METKGTLAIYRYFNHTDSEITHFDNSEGSGFLVEARSDMLNLN